MRLREAMLAALRHDAQLTRLARMDYLFIRECKFVSSRFRAKLGAQPEVCLTALECLADDWRLIKDGKAFLPPGQ